MTYIDKNDKEVNIGDRVNFFAFSYRCEGVISGLYAINGEGYAKIWGYMLLDNPSYSSDKTISETWERKLLDVSVSGSIVEGSSKKSVGMAKALPSEKPCKQCSKVNDIGVHKCWNCEVSSPCPIG